MHIAHITFQFEVGTDEDTAIEAIDRWTSSLRSNGQAQGKEMPLASHDGIFSTWLMLPAVDSLDSTHHNRWVRNAEQLLSDKGLRERTIRIAGESPDSANGCECRDRTAFILYTNYVSLESSLRCADCFDPVPLYAVPPTYDDSEYHDLLLWQSDYQACDQLQMGCSTGERFALREMGNIDSSLTRRGRDICQKLETGTGLPVYYFLYRYYGRSARFERERRCPGCGGEWLLAEPLHDLFDFRCEPCRLLSQIAFSS